MKKRYLVAAAAAAVGSSLVSGQAKAAGTYTVGGLENNFYIRTATTVGYDNPGTQIAGQPTNGSGSGIQIPGQDGNTSGSAITITGTVTAVLEQPGTFDGKTYGPTAVTYLLSDGTGSIEVFGTTSGYTATVGDNLTLTGLYSPFHEIPELETITSLTKNATGLPVGAIPGSILDPIPTNVDQINEVIGGSNGSPTSTWSVASPNYGLLGKLVSLNSVYITDGDFYPIGQVSATQTGTSTFGITNPPLGTAFNISNSGSSGNDYITDDNPSSPAYGDSTVFYYYATSYSLPVQNLGGTTIPQGDVNMVGFLAQFSGSMEFDVVSITAVPEPASLGLLAVGGLALLSRRRRRMT
jgi:hypothetical protein